MDGSKCPLQHSLDWTTAWVCSEVPEAMFVRAHAASNCKEGLQRKKNHRNYYPHQLDSKKWCRILSSGNTHLSSLSRQCTRIGSIPDFIRSSMGGLRSLDSSFLQGNDKKKNYRQILPGRSRELLNPASPSKRDQCWHRSRSVKVSCGRVWEPQEPKSFPSVSLLLPKTHRICFLLFK